MARKTVSTCADVEKDIPHPKEPSTTKKETGAKDDRHKRTSNQWYARWRRNRRRHRIDVLFRVSDSPPQWGALAFPYVDLIKWSNPPPPARWLPERSVLRTGRTLQGVGIFCIMRGAEPYVNTTTQCITRAYLGKNGHFIVIMYVLMRYTTC